MLTQIHIKHFVIVDELTIDFDHRLNILTGETGAGKSIWVDAVMLALGARLEINPVREGHQQCNITLCFDLTKQTTAQQWLKEHDFEHEEECLLRRTINKDGKSRSTLNGLPCPQSLIRDFASHLILTHGQHQHQALLKREKQRQQLDAFAGLSKEVKTLQQCFKEWQQIQNDIAQLKHKSPNKDDELQLLQFQLDELEQCALQDNEWKTLSDEHQRAANAKNLIDNINLALELTTTKENTNAEVLVQNALHQLNNPNLNDPEIDNIRGLLNTAAIHLQEAGSSLNTYRNSMDLSPEHLLTLESRLQQIHDLARKHHVPPEELHDIIPSLEHKISALENVDTRLDALQAASDIMLQQYQALAKKVTRKRKSGAKKLGDKVTDLMQQLGMEGGVFDIHLNPLDGPIHAHGQEQIDYFVSTNPGQPSSALSKVVSGGELSRISLALQVITAQYCHPPTLIFDEVDTGIGGITADKVGDMLSALATEQQVLCITHLAQIASKGHRHFKISKHIDKASTHSDVMQLHKQDRINEIARMLGGTSKTSQAHAKSLLKESH